MTVRTLPAAVAAVAALAAPAVCGPVAEARDATDAPTRAEQRFGRTLAHAIASDVASHPPGGRVARIVVRWFDPEQPGSLTVHVLTERERRRTPPANAWYPLEWRGVKRELRRATRVERAVAEAAEALVNRYDARPRELPDQVTASGEDLAPPAILVALRRLRGRLRAAGVPLDRRLSLSASHFEGTGTLVTLRRVASRKLLAVLRRRGELPLD